ncbi:hypothetical protein BV898_08876 [Hypsibius exemplaris]|nr:hypothetical protein BV898_08876 [Hypsibius exemplaris]
MALGTKGAADTFKASRQTESSALVDPLLGSEAKALMLHRDKLRAEINTLLQHNQFGATRQKLLCDKDADVKKSLATNRQAGKRSGAVA